MHLYLMRKSLWHFGPLLLALLLFLPGISLARENPSERISDVSASVEPYILASINRIRAEHHLTPLTVSPALQQFARDHSRYMAKSGYLGHGQNGMDFKARVVKARLKGWREIGENVGRSQGYRNNAETIISGWMESRPHRENILTAGFNMTGIGTAQAADGTLYATQVFMGSDDR
ncbi:MAG: CAP domain-containing protein [Geobacteraceae bacterium]